MICSTFITPQQSYGQFNFSHLDSLRNNFPPDSTYSKNRMIVKFKPTTLDLEQLCFTYESQTESIKQTEKTLMSDAAYYDLRNFLANQRFYAKDVITDTLLANFLVALGADTLSRMTFASPCVDTLSVTRLGDTIPIQEYLYMVLHFKNDTSIVMATYVLNALFNHKLEFAHPDFYMQLAALTPNDYDFGYQDAFTPAYTDVEGAWDYEIGHRGTKIAIIDDGILYTHCEFDQSEMSDNTKIVWGWNFNQNNSNIHQEIGLHGTRVAGIIGGLSNRSTCPAGGSGIAGINGGWGTLGGYPEERGIGASIYGYACGHDANLPGNIYMSSNISAIYDASSRPPNSKYGKGVHFINVSMLRKLRRGPWGVITIDPTPGLLQAVNHAYENKVSFATPRGNFEDTNPVEPACYEVNKVFSVGASIKNGEHQKTTSSSYGMGMDILAPAPACSLAQALYSTVWSPGYTYDCVGEGTSYASPQIAGIASLLHSYLLNSGLGWQMQPEDYEGILKVAAKDINHDPNGNYKNNYDIHSGWGLVNAKNIFTKIVDEGYELEHHSISVYEADAVVYDQWSHRYKMYFDNSLSDKYIPSGLYEVQRRKITYTITHPISWNDRLTWNNELGRNVDYKIYVWGNGGKKHDKYSKKGLSYTGDYGYNFQTGYTGVISGYGGNEQAEHNMIHDYATHGNNSHTFSFNNYQYCVYLPGGGVSYIPSEQDLTAHYSVFAKPIPPTSVSDKDQKNNFEIFPTITNQKIHLKNVNYDEISSVYIINALGEKVKEINNLIGVNFIDVANLPIGTYYVVFGNNRQNVQKFIIVR